MAEELLTTKTKSKNIYVIIAILGVILVAAGIFTAWKVSLKSNNPVNTASNLVSGQLANQITASTTSALDLAKTNEEESMIHYNAGVAYYNENKLDLAESEQFAAIKLSQLSPRPYAALSAIYLGRGDFSKALNYAQDSINIGSTTYPWGYNNKGIALMDLGRGAEAVLAFKKAVVAAPDKAVFKDNLASAEASVSSTKK